MRTAKVLAGSSVVLLLLAGYFFSLLVSTQQHVRNRQDMLAERLSALEARIELAKEHQQKCQCPHP